MVFKVGDIFTLDTGWRKIIREMAFDGTAFAGIDWFTQTMSIAFSVHEKFRVYSVSLGRESTPSLPGVYLSIDTLGYIEDVAQDLRNTLGSQIVYSAMDYFPKSKWRYEVWFAKEAFVPYGLTKEPKRIFQDFTF